LPRAINHVTKLFKGTYGLPRCPGGFSPKGLSNELRDTFGSSLGKLVSEIKNFKVLNFTKLSDFFCKSAVTA
jgi:hypothetical protein